MESTFGPRVLMAITYIPPANPGNPKGQRTFQIQFLDGHQLTACMRFSGEKVGDHFHKGEDPSKDPEQTILLSGVVKCITQKPGGEKIEIIIDAKGGPVLVEIGPMVWHVFECQTDCVFVERRVTHFDPARSDCYPFSELPTVAQPA